MKERRYALLIGLAAITTAAVAIPALAGPSELSQVRAATARYHSITQAEMAGYRSFLGCFDSADGGMGQHYVDQSIIDDGVADPLRPEALVYEVDGSKLFEVGGSKLSLVGVEWVEVGAATDTPLALFGEEFEYNPDLGVWALHAWIWRDNPDGMLADFNPEVADCPPMIPAWLP
jgi:hypothetical protein